MTRSKLKDTEIEIYKDRFKSQSDMVENQNISMVEYSKKAYENEQRSRKQLLQIGKLEMELTERAETLKSKEKELGASLELSRSTMSEFGSLKEKVEAQNIKISECESEREGLLKKIEDLSRELEEMGSTLEKSRSAEKDKMRQLEDIKEINRSSDSRIEELSKELEMLKANKKEELETSQTSSLYAGQKEESTPASKFKQTGSVSHQPQQISQVQPDSSALRIEDLEAQLQSAREKLRNYKEQNEHLTKELSVYSQSANQGSMHGSSSPDLVSKLRNEIMELEEDLSESNGNLEEAKKQCDDLKASKQAMQLIVDQMKKEKAEFNQIVIEKDCVVINMKNEMVEIKNAIDSFEKILLSNKKNAATNSQNQKQNELLKSEMLESGLLVTRIQSLEESYKKVATKYTDLKAKYSDMEKDIEVYEDEKHKLIDEKKEVLTRWTQAEQDRDSYKDQAQKLKGIIVDSELAIIRAKNGEDLRLTQRNELISTIKSSYLFTYKIGNIR